MGNPFHKVEDRCSSPMDLCVAMSSKHKPVGCTRNDDAMRCHALIARDVLRSFVSML